MLAADVRVRRRYSAMLTSPELSAVTGVHANALNAARSGRTSSLTAVVSNAGLSSHVVRVCGAGAGSAGRAVGAVVSAGETITLEKLAPPREPHKPIMPRVHGRFSDVTVNCGFTAPSTNTRAV